MNFLFSMPTALWGMLGIGVLVGIYLFRNRFRQQTVSSLMLWEDHRKPRQGGMRLSRIQTPLLFVLELLTIALLVSAAAGPLLRRQEEKASYVIVLDDSCSMRAGRETTARQRAMEEVAELLEQSGAFRAQFILAGSTVRLLGEGVETAAEVRRLLDGWTCRAPTADFDEALLLATELAGQTRRVLVVTDHAPTKPLGAGGLLEWRAFGRPLGNTAFVEAGYEADGRCFLAAANLSERPTQTSLVIETADGRQRIHEQAVELEPRQTRRIFFDMKDAPDRIRARLAADALKADDEVLLVREETRAVLLDVRIGDEELEAAVRRAVEASGLVALDSPQPHLLLTDREPSAATGSETWQTVFVSDPNAVSFMGPFLVDRSHPLTEGLSLDGVIWGAGKMVANGRPAVITAGNVPLVLTDEPAGGTQQIRIRLNPELSTLLQSPNWPVLIWNLLRWRQSYLPGLENSNYRLGQAISFVLPKTAEEAVLIGPAEERDLPPARGGVRIMPKEAGLYRIQSGADEYAFAVNLLSASESDLSGAASGRWGQWQEASLFRWEYRALDGLLLPAALALLLLHRWVHIRGGTEA